MKVGKEVLILAEKRVENERLGQIYTDPKNLISRGSDILIVGSGIHKKPTYEEQIQAAKAYQEAGWRAYEERLQRD